MIVKSTNKLRGQLKMLKVGTEQKIIPRSLLAAIWRIGPFRFIQDQARTQMQATGHQLSRTARMYCTPF